MAVKLKVNTEQLGKCANRIEDHLQLLNNEINELYTNELYQLAAAWKDKQCYDWTNRFTGYLNDLKSVSDSIANYVAFLRTSEDEYKKTIMKSCKDAQSKM